jgi:hypothetical protein
MKRTHFTLTAVVALLTASGVSAEPVRDVAWYTAHPKERSSKLAECRNNPGKLQQTPNCINAESAQTRAWLNSSNGPVKYTGKTF